MIPLANVPRPLPEALTPPRASVAIGFVDGLLSALEYQTERRRQLLKLAELANLYPAADRDGAQRVPLAHYTRLYRLTVTELGDEGFGLFSRPLRPGCFEWLARGALSVATVAEALERICDGLNLLQDNLRLELFSSATGRQLRISVVAPLPVGPSGFVFAHEWILRMIHGLAAWLAAHPLSLEHAAFPYPAPGHAADYELLFAANVQFDAPRLSADFPESLLALPARRDETALVEFMRAAPASITLLYRDERQLAPRLRQLLRDHLPDFLGLDQAAGLMGMAPRTLHRRLLAEGTHYRALRESLRRELARELLAKTSHPVTRIALDLGFADSTAFYRAFAAWEGCGPRQWRSANGIKRLLAA